MTTEALRAGIRLGVLALLVLAPLPFGSVEPWSVLAIELVAAVLSVATVFLISREREATTAIPKLPLVVAGVVVALGALQLLPLPFSLAERFVPTAELVRPLIPLLGGPPPPITWSAAASETVDGLLRFVAYALIGLATALAFDRAGPRRALAGTIVVTAVFQAVYGSGELLSGRQHIFGFAKKYYLDSATGTYINRNHYATFLASALPFAVALMIRSGNRTEDQSWRERFIAVGEPAGLRRLLAGASAALIWLGLLLSHSRAGLLAAIAGTAIPIARYRHERAARVSMIGAVVVLLGLLSFELAQAPGARFLLLRGDLSAQGGRLTVWRDSLDLIARRPLFGWGLGTFESVFPLVQSSEVSLAYDHAHNDWLEWTVEAGVLGLAAALTIAGLGLRAGLRTVTRARERQDAAISTASAGALLAIILHAAWDFSLRIPAIAVVAAVVVGTALVNHDAGAASRALPSAFPPPSTKASNQSSRFSRFQIR